MVHLEKCNPPLNEVALLGSNPLRVYTVLYDAAVADVRGNCGGTSRWTIKGMANELGVDRRTVASALDRLLDTGYIQIAGEATHSENGSNSTIWRVTHPDMLDAVRYSIEIMGPPSERLKKMRVKKKKAQVDIYEETEW